jgi:polysaccharide export outer membrane protein
MSNAILKRMLTAACLAASLAAVGCTALPHEGPSRMQVEHAHTSNNTSGFVLIDVNQTVANYLAGVTESTLGDRFGKGKPALINRIGSGDILAVRIWEADPGGLFGSTGLVNRGEIPNVVVDSRGIIQIPYAGAIRARGRTPAEVADAITRRLQSKTVEPQVHVAIAQNVANVATITGEVGQPGIYPLSLRGDTLLDVIAAMGGSRAPAYETMVRFTRSGKTAVTYLDQVVETRSSNLYIQPGDKLHLERRPKSYSAFGAVTKKGKHDFGSSRLTVLEAVGEASGLSDNRADPTGVFVMRFEDRERAYDLAGTAVPDDALPVVPVIYRFDLQDPNQYFFAQSINMRDKDVIYVANAPAVEVDKFLSIVGKGVGTAAASSSLANRLN